MSEIGEISCAKCKYAMNKDYGYSNWTVEGTAFYCLKKSRPDDGFDRFYGEEVRLKFAQQCDIFSRGVPVEVDCDEELGSYSDDPEIIDLLREFGITWENKP